MAPKLTPEEKKELKAQKKKEKKLKAQEKKKQLLRDRLDRELKYGNLTIRRHEISWRQMLIDITVPRIREQLIGAWHLFERVVDAKDFFISLLMDEIHDAEEQYMMNLRSHFEHIDNLILQFHDRLDELHEDNNIQLRDLIRRSLADLQKQSESSDKSGEYMKMMIYALEMKMKEFDKTTKVEYFSKMNERKSTYDNALFKLGAELDLKYENMWERIKNQQSQYVSKNENIKKIENALRVQDNKVQEVIAVQLKKLMTFKNVIKGLQKSYVDLGSTIGVELQYLLNEKRFFMDCYASLRARLFKDTRDDRNRRTNMTTTYRNTVDHLEKITEKGEKILKLYQTCRKYETIQEKVRPFPTFACGKRQQCDDELALFWQKISVAEAVRYTLQDEKEFLLRDNKRLRHEIDKFCQCIECATLPPIPKRAGKVPCTEGVFMIRNYKTTLDQLQDKF